MNIKITPKTLSGEVRAKTSKSAAHRALICAEIAKTQNNTVTEIRFDDTNEDIEATRECLAAMRENRVINCRESGSTFRFLLPLAAVFCGNFGNNCKTMQFMGEGRLPERPISDLLNTLRANGAEFSADKLPFKVSGRLKSGEYKLPGNVSSQFVSGLLFALPLLSGDSVITLTSPLESKAYVNMTTDALKLFGVEIVEKNNSYLIKGNQKYTSPPRINVESDWSNAAFFLVAGAIGAISAPVTLTNLNMDSSQGDKEIVKLLEKFGAEVEVFGTSVKVSPGKLHGIEIDVSEIPDLLPILAVVGSFAKGKTRLYNAARLRLKESDRLSSVAEMLGSFGVKVEEMPDSLVITGGVATGENAVVDGMGDHRIVMSAAICAAFCQNEVIIKGANAVNKSYPKFFEDFRVLGGVMSIDS